MEQCAPAAAFASLENHDSRARGLSGPSCRSRIALTLRQTDKLICWYQIYSRRTSICRLKFDPRAAIGLISHNSCRYSADESRLNCPGCCRFTASKEAISLLREPSPLIEPIRRLSARATALNRKTRPKRSKLPTSTLLHPSPAFHRSCSNIFGQ